MVADIQQTIKDYSQNVIRGQIRCDLEICPRCRHKPKAFKRHEARQRQFLVVVERLIIKVMAWLVRMKCSVCGKTFTQYPPFALPYKRYVSQEIMERSLRYLQDETISYEQATREQGTSDANRSRPPRQPMRVFHEDPGKARQLAASTIHRWITTLGALKGTLQVAMTVLLERDADSHRQSFDLAGHKYRSQQRKRLLQEALRLFHADARLRVLFDRSIFPDLAIGCCWR